MQRLVVATIVSSALACSGVDPETEPGLEPGGDETVLEPRGVVLENGRVITEEQASTGLVPKDALLSTTRLNGSLSQPSSLKIPDATGSGSVCALTMVWGVLTSFNSGRVGTLGSNLAAVTRQPDFWTLSTHPNFTGFPNPSRMAIEATCYSLSMFSAASGGVKWLSDVIEARVTAANQKLTVPTWKGDAATFLTGIAGNYVGTGEFARVSQNSNPSALSTVTVQSLQSQLHLAQAHAFFVGQPGGTHVPLFHGPRGIGSSSAAGEWTFNWQGGDAFHASPTRMAKSSEAFCYLTKVTGNWGPAHNGDPWVQIRLDANLNWVLDAWAPGNYSVNAVAACYKLRQ
jgi:hypothetical protein